MNEFVFDTNNERTGGVWIRGRRRGNRRCTLARRYVKQPGRRRRVTELRSLSPPRFRPSWPRHGPLPRSAARASRPGPRPDGVSLGWARRRGTPAPFAVAAGPPHAVSACWRARADAREPPNRICCLPSARPARRWSGAAPWLRQQARPQKPAGAVPQARRHSSSQLRPGI